MRGQKREEERKRREKRKRRYREGKRGNEEERVEAANKRSALVKGECTTSFIVACTAKCT